MNGVCQDVNFFLWHILRKKGIPSYLAVGLQGKNGGITRDSGHAKVIAYDKDKEEWGEYDSTPRKEDVEIYEMKRGSKQPSIDIAFLRKGLGYLSYPIYMGLSFGIGAMVTGIRFTKQSIIKIIRAINPNFEKKAKKSIEVKIAAGTVVISLYR